MEQEQGGEGSRPLVAPSPPHPLQAVIGMGPTPTPPPLVSSALSSLGCSGSGALFPGPAPRVSLPSGALGEVCSQTYRDGPSDSPLSLPSAVGRGKTATGLVGVPFSTKEKESKCQGPAFTMTAPSSSLSLQPPRGGGLSGPVPAPGPGMVPVTERVGVPLLPAGSVGQSAAPVPTDRARWCLLAR